MNGIVAIARAGHRRRDDLQVASSHEDLRIARPSVVLRLRRVAMIAGRDQRPVDDPRPTAVMAGGRGRERCEPWNHRGDDAVRARLRDAKHRRELAHGQVCAQRRARDEDALPERSRPRSAAVAHDRETSHQGLESTVVERGERCENACTWDRHCHKRDVGSVGGVVWEADPRSKQADAVVAEGRRRCVRVAPRARHE